MAMSARNFHYERGRPGKATKWIRPNRETKEKRGLRALLPIQQKVRDYFYNYEREDRWIRLHNLFAYVMEEQGTEPRSETGEAADDLRAEMRTMVTAVQPKKRRKPPRLKAPDFGPSSHEYADLLLDVKNQLREQELHSNFDYLAFFRRGFALVQHIRGEILFDSKQELAKIDLKRENPSNHDLLARLLHGLKIQPKDKNIEAKGDELSKDVVAVEQLQRISKIMGDLIEKEGRVELDKAEKCLRRWWDASGPRSSRGSKGRPFGIFHRFTYAAIVSRKRRVATIRDPRNVRTVQIAWKPSDKGKHTRLVGKKKTRVAFPCHGDCSMSRACLGRPSKQGTPSSKMLLKPKAGAGLPQPWFLDEGVAGDGGDDREWETDSDQSDSEYFSALEEQE
ncbi:hypothetical protein K491DRAFT_691139 [Lophiostoma macrostomum CBS 122681]|uniref:Uncharacterized protein n=1 Tax=Lophiostoma macrostomum CBS 122681 TaxID=1314788 RepID=A0A6A6TBX2_9PLEO|nr:hypothetical protein K491DRAFT_691139 [Lophiostoma macrostomum CBS 122681]